MRVLVAGWHGQVAMALSETAAGREDVERYAVGRPALDLTDRPTVGRTLFDMKPDVIINTAAYTDVEGAEREPHIAARRNVEGAAALASQAARIGVPIVHLSTVYVFDGVSGDAANHSYRETDTANPINAYGHSKLNGEAAVAAANPRHIILRTGWVYSPFGRNFVTNILDRGRSSASLEIDRRQTGSPTYAPHLAAAILNIASVITSRSDDSLWGTYHVADHGSATWMDMAQEAFGGIESADKVMPELIPTEKAPSAGTAARPQHAVLDCSKVHDVFGIQLPDWQDGVRDCVQRARCRSA